ncbi:MAG: Mth938-like domain-containing protein [Alphaproteobacteria bacterium]
MDITPDLPTGRKLIESYGDGGFRIDGVHFAGSVLVFPARVSPWPVTRIEAADVESFAEVLAESPKIEILVVGCGARLLRLPRELRENLRAAGLAADLMNTGAACRTFNLLLVEDRRVAAALIAVA